MSKLSTSTIPDSLLIAGKGVMSGLLYGFTGIVRKPIEEEQSKGFKGIFTGLGKGSIGLFAKPVGSLFDGVSLSLDSLKRFSQTGQVETANIRFPRHLINDVVKQHTKILKR